jgi:hypothetical protein
MWHEFLIETTAENIFKLWASEVTYSKKYSLSGHLRKTCFGFEAGHS